MAAEHEEHRPIDYHRFLPWLHLGRAFRMAVDPRKLLLAGLALFAITGLDVAYNAMRFSKKDAEAAPSSGGGIGADLGKYAADIEELSRPNVPQGDDEKGKDEEKAKEPPADDLRYYMASQTEWPWEGFEAVLDRGLPSSFSSFWATCWTGGREVLLQPLGTIIDPVIFQFGPRITLMDRIYLVVRLLWALAVWGIVAGAITRMVALEFARDERLGTVASIKYACSRFLSFLFAPLIAVILLAVIVFFCWLGGLVGWILPLFAGVLWFLPLLAGFVMALVLVGALLGWSLMYATISTQDSDAFDGFSRSYTFVYGRPWYFGLLVLVTLFLVAFGFGLVYVLVLGTDQLSQGAVAIGMGDEAMTRMFDNAPDDETNSGTYPAIFWRRTLLLLAGGFGASFFWVASTISYFLLRRADDGTELDEVEIQYDAPTDTLAPLAGVPAEPAAPPVVQLDTPPAAEESPSDAPPESIPLAGDEPGDGDASDGDSDDEAGEKPSE